MQNMENRRQNTEAVIADIILSHVFLQNRFTDKISYGVLRFSYSVSYLEAHFASMWLA